MPPKLRDDIEIIPTQYQGEKALVVKDSLGLIREPVLLRGEVLDFLSLMDGEKSIQDIQVDLIRLKNGIFVSSDDVRKVISELDSAFLLDSERCRQEKNKIIEEYSQLRIRPAFLSGKSYPASAEKLHSHLDSFLRPNKDLVPELKGKEIRALIAPHIDLEVGKTVYAKAYGALKDSSPKKILLLGTGHSLQEHFLSLTEKDFETPLGRVKTDKEWIRKLREVGRENVSPDDFAHRSEHSLEFQLIFLQHIFGSEFDLIPILCGSFHRVIDSVSRPSEIAGMNDFLNTLRFFGDEETSDALVVAGVDFSHIGPKFGHRQQASFLLLEAKSHDKILIDAICAGDVVQFWAEIKRVHNKYNVCGFSALACLMEIMPEARGHLLDYYIWEEEPTQSAVSFAGIVMTS